MTAATVIALARQALIEFIDDTQFITDAEMLVLLSAEIPLLLDRILALNNPSFPLPDDATQTIDVSALAADGYALHVNFWRARRVELRAGTARSRVTLVPESAGYSVPDRVPSAFILGKKLFAVDGAPTLVADRVHGWAGATEARVLWIPIPADLAAAGDTVKSPDEARAALAAHLAYQMAVRAKPAGGIIDKLMTRREEAYAALDGTVLRYGRDG